MASAVTVTRDSLIVEFGTEAGRVRSMNVPDPAPDLGALEIASAGASMANAGIFAEGAGGGGLTAVRGALYQREITDILFGS